MAHRFTGEFRPPRELAAMSAARVVGQGELTVVDDGLEVAGKMIAAPMVSKGWIAVVMIGGAAVSSLVPALQQLLLPLTLLCGGVLLYFYWRAEIGVPMRARVPWSDVEHIVRLGSEHEVLAVVFSGPIRGPGSPELVYFAATLGLGPLAEAIRDRREGTISMDLDSGLNAADDDSGLDATPDP